MFHPQYPLQPIVTKHFNLLGPFVRYKVNDILQIRTLGLYSQYFIFFIAWEWAQQAKVLHFTSLLERSASHKRSNFLDPFISYEENEVLLFTTLHVFLS